MNGAPYDAHAAALQAVARARYPDVSDPPVEQVVAMEALLVAAYRVGALHLPIRDDVVPQAWLAGHWGRPSVPPA